MRLLGHFEQSRAAARQIFVAHRQHEGEGDFSDLCGIHSDRITEPNHFIGPLFEVSVAKSNGPLRKRLIHASHRESTPATPNHALQRTRLRVTPAASSLRLSTHHAAVAPHSRVAELGVVRPHRHRQV